VVERNIGVFSDFLWRNFGPFCGDILSSFGEKTRFFSEEIQGSFVKDARLFGGEI